MRNHRLLFLAGCFLTVPASGHSADGATLDGLWRSSSGAVYRYVQRGETVVATYEVLIEGQVAAGIKKGDLSLKGTYVDNVLSATFYQRAPLHIQAMCPEHQIIDLPVAWELNENVLGGTLVLVFGSDDHCQIMRRQLQTFRLERESRARMHTMLNRRARSKRLRGRHPGNGKTRAPDARLPKRAPAGPG